jgi:phytoene desaturase
LQKAIIIGAGVAGLAAAIRLAVQGFEVEVFEKNDYPGGKLSHFNLGNYQFDAGPSLFVQPENIVELFALADEPIEEYFTYQALPIACKYFYSDGTIVNAYTNANQFAKELQDKLGEDENKLHQYLANAAKVYNNIGSIFLGYSLHKRTTLFRSKMGKVLASVKSKLLFKTMDGVNKQSFTNPQTVQLFNRFATYNGSNPYQAPAMLTMIPHLEHNQGIYYPKGGMISITNALYKLAIKKGVQFHFNSPVQNIINHNHKVAGVVVNNKNINANIVVSNMDAYFTYKHLLNNMHKAKKLLKQERSSSAFIFYWGIKKEFAQLQLHNIFFSNNYKAEFDSLFKTKTIYVDPTIYLNITSKCEAGVQAETGKENWFVMVNAPANIGQNWEAFKQQYRQAILQKLSNILQTGIEPLIEVEEILDPILIESKTASYQGSLYGTSSNSKMAAFLRHPNFTNAIKGLYFVGGSVHPGGGIPLCLHSAKIMSEIVKEDFKKVKHH